MRFDLKQYEKFFDRMGLREIPLGAFYADEKPAAGVTPKGQGHVCLFALLKKARQDGETVYFDGEHTGCGGGAYYMGFRDTPMPKIEYFLSCGIPGEMEGERYIKTPEIAREFFAAMKPRKAPAEYCVFKPLHKLLPAEDPEVIIFFAPPDILSGLFTLTHYATGRPDAVRVPFSSGCGSILTHPLKEAEKQDPQAVLGLFDVSARPFVEADILTLAMPAKMFPLLLQSQEESFLITKSWERIRERIGKARKP
jgi:uncharacterized protein (DUF169 family)